MKTTPDEQPIRSGPMLKPTYKLLVPADLGTPFVAFTSEHYHECCEYAERAGFLAYEIRGTQGTLTWSEHHIIEPDARWVCGDGADWVRRPE